jgi:hypothetical protein
LKSKSTQTKRSSNRNNGPQISESLLTSFIQSLFPSYTGQQEQQGNGDEQQPNNILADLERRMRELFAEGANINQGDVEEEPHNFDEDNIEEFD